MNSHDIETHLENLATIADDTAHDARLAWDAVTTWNDTHPTDPADWDAMLAGTYTPPAEYTHLLDAAQTAHEAHVAAEKAYRDTYTAALNGHLTTT